MMKRLMPKPFWKEACGASLKPKRLKLNPQKDGLFICPVRDCDSESYRSKRGCRKHVFNRHGWYYYFDSKPEVSKVLPETNTRISTYKRSRRSCTSTMPSFLKTCRLAVGFATWLKSPGGSGKSFSQADQITAKVLKYTKFCCNDVSSSWEIPFTVIDYCIGCVTMLSDFVEYLQTEWKLGYSGVIGYMNAINHMLDYRRSSDICKKSLPVFIASEIYLERVKKYLVRKMKVEWNTLLSVEYLQSINCWATLEDLQKVIPYHSDKYKQIALNAKNNVACVPAHDISFATGFIVSVLFLMVKACRPMTYQNLTITMIKSVKENGIIDQTVFKTNEKYGFDSLIFSVEVLTLINCYIDSIRPRLNPACEYLLVCRNGKQLTKLCDIFGRIVFDAIGKYINPTRYRQIIETESAEHLDVNEQEQLSKDQKHTSLVAKVHYQKLKSHKVAQKAKECMNKLRNQEYSTRSIVDINNSVDVEKETEVNFEREIKKAPVNVRQQKVAFSALEDKFLLDGLKKHGRGKWTSILNDNSYSFHCSRKPSTLAVRAKTKMFI